MNIILFHQGNVTDLFSKYCVCTRKSSVIIDNKFFIYANPFGRNYSVYIRFNVYTLSFLKAIYL